MTWFDVGALVVVIAMAVEGHLSGVVWAALELAALMAAAALARATAPLLTPYVAKLAELDPAHLSWTSHALILGVLLATLIALLILLRPLQRKWRFDRDRWPGAVVGVLTGAVLAGVILAVTLWASPRGYEAALEGCQFRRALAAAHDNGGRILFPEGIEDRLRDLERP